MVHMGGKAPDPSGYDLLGAFVGSEGTLGIATKITLDVVREPEASRTLLAAFLSVEGAGGAVSGIIAAGVLPAAEIMDPLSIEAVEEAVHPGYPEGAGAVLILDLDGPGGEVEHRLREVERICRENGAIEVRVASDADESALIWKGRKAQFAAMARLGHDCYVQDSVVPRTALAEVLGRIADLSDEWGLKVANAFHAGDGNLHPMILYDGRVEGEADRAHELAGEILLACLAHGALSPGSTAWARTKRSTCPRSFRKRTRT
jgi:glycolate oxidase